MNIPDEPMCKYYSLDRCSRRRSETERLFGKHSSGTDKWNEVISACLFSWRSLIDSSITYSVDVLLGYEFSRQSHLKTTICFLSYHDCLRQNKSARNFKIINDGLVSPGVEWAKACVMKGSTRGIIYFD